MRQPYPNGTQVRMRSTNLLGVIRDFNGNYAVEFFDRLPQGLSQHDCAGKVPNGMGRWLHSYEFELLDNDLHSKVLAYIHKELGSGN